MAVGGNVILHKNNEMTTDFSDPKATLAYLGIQPHQDAAGRWTTSNASQGAFGQIRDTKLNVNQPNLKAIFPDEAERKAFVDGINSATPQELNDWIVKGRDAAPKSVIDSFSKFAEAMPVEKAKDPKT